MCSFVSFCSGEAWASTTTRTRVGVFLHNLGNSSPLWRCFQIIMTSIPPKHLPKVLQRFLANATLMKMSNMLHTEVPTAILNKLKSVRRRGDTGTKYQELFPRVFPRCSTGDPHNLFLKSKWFFHDCCLCNRCNVMVNALYLPFASSISVHCPPFASEEVFWANFSWEEKLESSFPFFSCTLYEK